VASVTWLGSAYVVASTSRGQVYQFAAPGNQEEDEQVRCCLTQRAGTVWQVASRRSDEMQHLVYFAGSDGTAAEVSVKATGAETRYLRELVQIQKVDSVDRVKILRGVSGPRVCKDRPVYKSRYVTQCGWWEGESEACLSMATSGGYVVLLAQKMEGAP